ncbi:site-specific recombinase XerD [Kushneria sinocarnis]|uniref:Site-specific recombinase XerD n=1 Tax=Kushneria sinocarnis TaxID=595502 RepID=A0A420WUI1_9GAMM|nr:site-specific integrase [Kushneria sinocarnis]RKQ97094.1 site-specific recombinase XerD [Kushneria sinocarnis]
MPRKQKDGLYQRSGSPYWWASWIGADGERHRQSTKIRVDRAGAQQEADALLSKWKYEAHQQRVWGKPQEKQKHALKDVLDAYMAAKGYVQSFGRSRAAYIVRHVMEAFDGRMIEDIHPSEIRAYRRRRRESVGASTVNKETGLISAACNYCRNELDWDIPNPAHRQKEQEPRGRTRWAERSQIERLIAVADRNKRAPWIGDHIRLSVFTGLRAGDVSALTWDRVDMQRCLLRIPSRQNRKMKEDRIVPLNDEAMKAIRGRKAFRDRNCPESPWVFCNWKGERIKDMKRAFNTAIREAGIEDFRRHDARHTFASYLLNADVPMEVLSKAMGHSDINTTQRYAHLRPTAVQEAVNRLSAQNSHTGESNHD